MATKVTIEITFDVDLTQDEMDELYTEHLELVMDTVLGIDEPLTNPYSWNTLRVESCEIPDEE